MSSQKRRPNRSSNRSNRTKGTSLAIPGPTSIDDFVATRIEDMRAKWDQQRKSNLEAHFKKVSEKDGSAAAHEMSEKQFELTLEWVNGAQHVDPHEKEIAALWQALLGAIYKKDRDTKELLNIIKQLDARDARLLVSINRYIYPKSQAEKSRAARLASIGVLESFDWIHAARTTLMPLVFFAATLIAVYSIPDDIAFFFKIDPISPHFRNSIPFLRAFSAFTLLTIFLLLALRFLQSSQRYILSELGETLRISAERYLAKKP